MVGGSSRPSSFLCCQPLYTSLLQSFPPLLYTLAPPRSSQNFQHIGIRSHQETNMSPRTSLALSNNVVFGGRTGYSILISICSQLVWLIPIEQTIHQILPYLPHCPMLGPPNLIMTHRILVSKGLPPRKIACMP